MASGEVGGQLSLSDDGMTETGGPRLIQGIREDIESALRAELADASLVGEVPLDYWGPLTEAALRERLTRWSVSSVARKWPATFATYLVYEGLEDDARSYWDDLAIPELRHGQEVGPCFEKALTDLKLATFDNLELNEGFEKGTAGRYLRRIRLHGGLPARAVPPVLQLLVDTMRSGITTAPDVVEAWASLDLDEILRRKAAVRLFAYTGDFGVHLVDDLMALLRAAELGQGLESVDVPPHLTDAARLFFDRGAGRKGARVQPGASIRFHPGRAECPVLEVPPGTHGVWRIDGRDRGTSSSLVINRFNLDPPVDPRGWLVGSTASERRFASEHPSVPVFVFDERGRLHPRGTTLGGLRCFVVAPIGSVCTSDIDRTDMAGAWSSFEIVTCDLRGSELLEIQSPDGAVVAISTDCLLHPEIAAPCHSDVTTDDGLPVYSAPFLLAFRGFTPEPSEVSINYGGVVTPLDAFEMADGAFDLTRLLATAGVGRAQIQICRKGGEPVAFDFSFIPGLTIQRPEMAPTRGEVEVRVTTSTESVVAVVPHGNSSTIVQLKVGGRGLATRVGITRPRWAVERPGLPVLQLNDERVDLRWDELRDAELLVDAASVPLEVEMRAGTVLQSERLRPRRDGLRSLPLRVFADTSRAAGQARLPLKLVRPGGGLAHRVGSVESRFVPSNLAVAAEASADRVCVTAEWREGAEWPNRVVRIWQDHMASPTHTLLVPAGETRVEVDLEAPAPGRYLVEVALEDSWAAVARPSPSVGCCPLYLGLPHADALRKAVLVGDRRARFPDSALDELVPLLADLVEELLPLKGEPNQRQELLNRLLESEWRAIDVVDELADRYEVLDDSGRANSIQPLLIEWLPYAFDAPIRHRKSQDEDVRLDNLWVTAPVLAACLDAGRDDDACAARWWQSTGRTIRHPHSVKEALDRLVAQVPDKLTDGGEDGPILTSESWGTALEELAACLGGPVGPQVDPVLRLATRIRSPKFRSQIPRWSGLANRFSSGDLFYVHARDLQGALVALSCALLDSESARWQQEVTKRLLTWQGFAPTAVRNALVCAAAGLRLLEDVESRGRS